MKFAAKTVSYLISLLGHQKGKTSKKKATAQKKIQRLAHTDYRLVFDGQSKDWFICFGACIKIEKDDVDFEYFQEGRTGLTTSTIYGTGAIEFDAEQQDSITAKESEDTKESSTKDDYVFATLPQLPMPYYHQAETLSHGMKNKHNGIMIELATKRDSFGVKHLSSLSSSGLMSKDSISTITDRNCEFWMHHNP